jgi:hypothetical protein
MSNCYPETEEQSKNNIEKIKQILDIEPEGTPLFSATVYHDDSPVTKGAGCLSTEHYEITIGADITKQHLGKFLDFLLNANWKDQWGMIQVEEILSVKQTTKFGCVPAEALQGDE